MFASGFRVVDLGCKDIRIQHVNRETGLKVMYLNDPDQSLDISCKVKYDTRYYTVYASARSMKNFECGDVGHKCSFCPHREQAIANDVSQEIRIHAGTRETEYRHTRG